MPSHWEPDGGGDHGVNDPRVVHWGFFGGGERRDTEKFNGYGDQVASLYAGMDLIENY